jgi:hypothetical protein
MKEYKLGLTPKQAEAWCIMQDSPVTELGYGGAARGGKSWLYILS